MNTTTTHTTASSKARTFTFTAGLALAAAPLVAGTSVDPCGPDGSLASPSFTRAVEIAGGRLFVLDDAILEQDLGGLRVFDLTDPMNPAMTDSIATPGYASDIAVSGTTAYIADGGTGGLQVVDLSVPGSPVITGSYDSPGLASAVALLPFPMRGDATVALADGADGVNFIDMFGGVPDSGLVIDTDGLATDVAVVGTTLYVADGWNGLVVYDIADEPVMTARIPVTHSAQSLAVDEASGLLYVGGSIGGVLVVDIANPFSPAGITEYNTPGAANGLAVSGTDLYVADMFDGLHTLDAGVPPFIGITDTHDTGGAASDVALLPQAEGTIAYVAAAHGGVAILNLQPCEFCPADFAAPFGVLDLSDITAFVSDFQDPFSDNRAEALAEPTDIADLADIVAFVESFTAGCP